MDETSDPRDQSENEDFMHTLNPIGFTSLQVFFKKGCPIILLKAYTLQKFM